MGATEKARKDGASTALIEWPPLPSLEPEDRQLQQYEQLLKAASHCFGRLGFKNTSVLDIVTEARLSKRTFYEFFRDKEDCFGKLADHALVGIVRAMMAAAEAKIAEGPEATMLAMLRGAASFFATDARLYEVARDEEFLLPRRAATTKLFAGVLGAVAVKLGTTLDKRELEQVATFLAHGILGFFSHDLVISGRSDKTLRPIAAVLCRGLLPPPADLARA